MTVLREDEAREERAFFRAAQWMSQKPRNSAMFIRAEAPHAGIGSQEVYERCRDRCEMAGASCWAFEVSLNNEHRSCTIWEKVDKFTSSRV